MAKARNRHLFHGDDDRTVPLRHGRSTFKPAAEPKRITVQKTGDHRMSNPVHQAEFRRQALDWFRKSLAA